MSNRISFFISVFISCFAPALSGQTDTLRLTLADVVGMARTQSVDAAAALTELRTAYWQYRTYRADLLPEVSFTATLPSYTKHYSSYQESDGSYTFVHNDNVELSGELSLSQKIWFSGGTLSLRSSLDYMRQLSGTRYGSFMSIPVALQLEQPLFGINTVKWDRRIEPVRYAEAKARFISETEEVAMEAIRLFFNLLVDRESLASSEQNLANARKLYEVAKAKRRMGQISENDLMQIELTMINAQAACSTKRSNLKSSSFSLASFLGIAGQLDLDLIEPTVLPTAEVDYNAALSYAEANNPFMRNIRRRQLEADYEVAKAKAAQRQVNLTAQIGFTGTASTANEAYSHLHDNRIVQVGIAIPLIDWGRRRAAVKVAESQRELTENTILKENLDFNRNLFVLVERFNNQREQLTIAARACEIAQKRYDTNVETFMIGRISTLDLSDSQQSKDSARQTLLNEMFSYWYYYYQLRSITLWDFSRSAPIDADFESILKEHHSLGRNH